VRLFAAMLALSACSPAAASLPWVRIDPALPGVVCSREAAVSIAQKREQERAEWQKQVINCDERASLADARAERAMWWQMNGPLFIAGAAVVSLVAGGVFGFVMGDRYGK